MPQHCRAHQPVTTGGVGPRDTESVCRPFHFIDPDDDPCAERDVVDPLDDVDRRGQQDRPRSSSNRRR
jgi:hypothetical protein